MASRISGQETKLRGIPHFAISHLNKGIGMKRVIKQVLGIDVAQKELVVCLGRMHDDLTSDLFAHHIFPNTAKGMGSLLAWVGKLTDPLLAVHYVMEATGVYHERLAYFLDDNARPVSVVLPNKISNYARSLSVKTVTDRTACEAIARFGLERHLEPWHKPQPVLGTMRQLTRERDQIVAERSMAKNQLHAEKAQAQPHAASVKRVQQRIRLLDRQEKEITAEIADVVREDGQVSESVKLLRSIPGVGLLTAASVLAETNGFELIRNKRQLTSYAGLDVVEKQSGTSVRGKPRISKRGNRYLRKAMHMPALTAIRHDQRFKGLFVRLVSKHGVKMKAVVAVQRKLLELMYTVHSTGVAYDRQYLEKQQNTGQQASSDVQWSKKLEAA